MNKTDEENHVQLQMRHAGKGASAVCGKEHRTLFLSNKSSDACVVPFRTIMKKRVLVLVKVIL